MTTSPKTTHKDAAPQAGHKPTEPEKAAQAARDQNKAMFQPFAWTHVMRHDVTAAQMLLAFGRIHDLTRGVRVLVEMIEHDNLEDMSDDPEHLLSRNHRGILERMAIAAADAAADEAERAMSWIDRHHAKDAS